MRGGRRTRPAPGSVAAAGGPAFSGSVRVYTAAVAYRASILIGLPLYLALPETARRSTAATAVAGGVVAALVPALTGAFA